MIYPDKSKGANPDYRFLRPLQSNLNYHKINDGGLKDKGFFDHLIKYWKFSAPNVRDLMLCSAAEFAHFMPEGLAETALSDRRLSEALTDDEIAGLRSAFLPRRAQSPRQTKSHRRISLTDFRMLHVDAEYDNLDIEEAIRNNNFNQKFLYLDRMAAVRWRRLTSNPQRYSTFRNCKETLEDLVSLPSWKAVAEQTGRVVVFGGGAPTKDDVLIRSLLNGEREDLLQYIVIDTSVHMLLSTVEGLDVHLGRPQKEHIDLVSIVGDFEKLKSIFNAMNRGDQDFASFEHSAMFFLPGNTIANFQPEVLLEDVYESSSTGDFLLISVEFPHVDKIEELKEELKKRYNDEDLRELIIPPIRPFLDENGIDVLKDRGEKVIKSNIVSGHYGLAHITDIITAEIRLIEQTKGIDVVLARSSRYLKSDFINFVWRQGFSLMLSTSMSGKYHDHCQLLFQRLPARPTGDLPTGQEADPVL